jgi:hypothetical protein
MMGRWTGGGGRGRRRRFIINVTICSLSFVVRLFAVHSKAVSFHTRSKQSSHEFSSSYILRTFN